MEKLIEVLYVRAIDVIVTYTITVRIEKRKGNDEQQDYAPTQNTPDALQYR